MAYAGQTITNPITGEQITFLKVADNTRGQSLLFDCRVPPNGMSLPAHVHASQEERLTVICGTLGVMRGGTVYKLSAGDTIVLPPNVKHRWWNAGEDEVYFRAEVAPAGNLEEVLEVLSGMAHDGRLNDRAMPRNPFDLANLFRLSELYWPSIPVRVQKAVLLLVSLLGRLLGHRSDFGRYRARGFAPKAVAEPDAA